ncbi:MAG: hypothetical protein COU09_00905 [Candidatus Harrisonbacteria bacterium CG10_big_fil_rev_8_21_14_0_10_44_23]|uniref:DOD-type homing endonuclease domain-containing protein n=1 Tax=Candidatus Harrisonbacteria bacterium CG10_big_fil_rev_8_21_14_0_10_44_23 TaxID=1974585 RepID=A0A2H0UQL0_9BACT|nr:MAG: hypothetical protein COU09_00905 [Candidatus Harrisonbacteria bacterium CG10_big_fil_rev_8_21_14_0_10_44_23]
MRRLSKVSTAWSPALAYAIGLIASDGNLSPDGRHINFTSKDIELVKLFKASLNLNNKIGRKSRGADPSNKKYFVVQFGDINFYEFLQTIGLMPAKSKILCNILVPDKYFIDFLRGCIDGDGNIGTFIHPQSKNAQLRIRLFSASPKFLHWIKKKVLNLASINSGWIENNAKHRVYILSYAKTDSIILLNLMYYPRVEYFLKRKYNKARPFIRQKIKC